MEFKELQGKKEAELQVMLAAAREKLRELRFKDANNQLKDVREIRREKLLVARILTMLNKS